MPRLVRTTALALLALGVGGTAGAADAKLLPRVTVQPTWNQVNDALGNGWRVQQDGSLPQPQTYAYNQAGELYIDGNNPSYTAQAMTPDGTEYVISGTQGQLDVVRRIRIDAKAGAARFIEIVTNKASSSATVNLGVSTQLCRQAQSLLTETGGAANGNGQLTVPPKDAGLALYVNQRPITTSVVLSFGDPRSTLKPTVNISNQYQVFAVWALTIPPGRTVAVTHAIAQRAFQGPPDAKTLQPIFRAMRARTFFADVPAALRRLIVNGGPAGGMSAARGEAFAIPEELAGASAAGDVIALAKGTRLRGQASCAKLHVAGAHGAADIPFEKVAAIASGPTPSSQLVYLRDGQVLAGTVTADKLAFVLAAGPTLALEPRQLGWLVLKSDPAAHPESEAGTFVQTVDGERLRVEAAKDAKLRALTAWGELAVPLADVSSLRPCEDQPGRVLALKDGSAVYACLRGGALTVTTPIFGETKIALEDVVGIEDAAPADEIDEDALGAHLDLIGGQRLCAKITLPEVHLLVEGNRVALPPAQIRALENLAAREEGDGVRADLWGGDAVAGALEEQVLPVALEQGGTLEVPLADVLEAKVSTPTLTATMRDRIADLIQDLGAADWARREAASKALADLGEAARLPLEEAVRRSGDPEVRRRAQIALDSIK